MEAVTELHVSAFIDTLSNTRHDKPIDLDKLNYGQWGEHTDLPYQTLEEGVQQFFGISRKMEIERILEK